MLQVETVKYAQEQSDNKHYKWSKTGSQIVKMSVISLCNGCSFLIFLCNAEWDPYYKVKLMLENLKLQDLLQKFFDNCIRVSFPLVFGASLADVGIYLEIDFRCPFITWMLFVN